MPRVSSWLVCPTRSNAICAALLTVLIGTPISVQAQPASWSFQHAGQVSGLYLHQNTSRGADGLGATTWWMPGITRSSQHTEIALHAMFTLDPLIQGDCGYPRLMTSFTICNDAPFEDRAMVHPLIMGLSSQLERKVGRDFKIGIELAAAGEPAFGPPSYFMRASASNDPIIPLTHHSLNPFHTAYGVITPSWQWRSLRAEASVYNGNGNDQDPYNFDFAPMHSYAGRVTYALSAALSAQVSATSMQSAGAMSAHGGHGDHGAAERTHAFSASLQAGSGPVNRRLDASLAWSAHRAGGTTTHAALLEAQFELGPHAWFSRAELADRIEIEHVINPDGSHGTPLPRRQRINELTGGYAFKLPAHWGVQASIGVRGSTMNIPNYLNRVRYNTNRGSSFAIFTSLRPARMQSHQHHSETQH